MVTVLQIAAPAAATSCSAVCFPAVCCLPAQLLCRPATHRPLLGTVKSFQIVTSATAQLLSNMAMGALWSCSRAGAAGASQRASCKQPQGVCMLVAGNAGGCGGGVRQGEAASGIEMVGRLSAGCCHVNAAAGTANIRARHLAAAPAPTQGATSMQLLARLTGCQHCVVKARRYRTAGAPSSSSSSGDRLGSACRQSDEAGEAGQGSRKHRLGVLLSLGQDGCSSQRPPTAGRRGRPPHRGLNRRLGWSVPRLSMAGASGQEEQQERSERACGVGSSVLGLSGAVCWRSDTCQSGLGGRGRQGRPQGVLPGLAQWGPLPERSRQHAGAPPSLMAAMRPSKLRAAAAQEQPAVRRHRSAAGLDV